MIYKTVQGQAWDEIAKEVYGDEKHTDFLMKNNPKLLEIFVFSAGMEVEIPELPEDISELPSWRKIDE